MSDVNSEFVQVLQDDYCHESRELRQHVREMQNDLKQARLVAETLEMDEIKPQLVQIQETVDILDKWTERLIENNARYCNIRVF